MKSYYLTFIGGGPNNAVVLIQLLKRLNSQIEKGNLVPDNINILFLDKNGDFFKGLAWGRSRQSEYFSLSAPASEHFIRNNDPEEFVKFLFKNKNKYFSDSCSEDYKEFKNWLDSETIPRSFVGDFLDSLRNEVEELQQKLCEKGVIIDIDFRKSWAMGMSRDRDGYYIKLAEDTKVNPIKTVIDENRIEIIKTKNCCLGLGIPQDPVFTLRVEHYFPTIYGTRGIQDFYNLIEKDLANRVEGESSKKSIAFLGSNASFMDFARTFAARKDLHDKFEITVISNGGRVPAEYLKSGLGKYTCKYLSVNNNSINKCEDIIECYEKEILEAKSKGYTKYDLWISARNVKNALIKRLSPDEQERFVKHFDQKYDRLITTTSPEGAKEVSEMIKSGVIRIEKGNVLDVDLPPTTDKRVDVLIEGRGAMEFDYVISGLGQQKLDRTKFPLLRDIIKNGIAEINKTGKGFVVNNRLEVSPGLIVVGPLLTGLTISPKNIDLAITDGDIERANKRGYSSKDDLYTGLHNLAEGRNFLKIAVTTLTNRLLGKAMEMDFFVTDPTNNIKKGTGPRGII